MTHTHPHDHHHHHHGPHPQAHDHAPPGHNHPHDAEHLHSHPHGAPHESGGGTLDDQLRDWIDNFVDGFEAAEDKTGFLRLARVPFELPAEALGGNGSGPALKLIDVQLTRNHQVGTASPGFASDELVYHPYPGRLVRTRTDMIFVYVSLRERRDVPLIALADMLRTVGDSGEG